MRIIIESQGVYLEVENWFCEKERITHRTAEIVQQTNKAVLLDINGGLKWIPKSLFTTHKIPAGLGLWGV